jgi:hypothetical protein
VCRKIETQVETGDHLLIPSRSRACQPALSQLPSGRKRNLNLQVPVSNALGGVSTWYFKVSHPGYPRPAQLLPSPLSHLPHLALAAHSYLKPFSNRQLLSRFSQFRTARTLPCPSCGIPPTLRKHSQLSPATSNQL